MRNLCVTAIEYGTEIDTGVATPVRHPSGRLPFNLQTFVKKLLEDDMLEQRIIELASGPWSFRCQTKMVHHAFMGLSSSEQSHQTHLTTPDTSV